MEIVKQLRIEAANLGVPLVFFLEKANIKERSYYRWASGYCTPSAESMLLLEHALDMSKKIRCVTECQRKADTQPTANFL